MQEAAIETQPDHDEVVAVVPGDVEMTADERAVLACRPINELEALLLQHPDHFAKEGIPTTHRFIEKNNGLESGMYVREVVLPAGAIITTEIHRTRHPFVISKGTCEVWSPRDGWQILSAPMTGITEPATRRVIHVLAETIWTTFHAVNITVPEEVVAFVTLPHRIVGTPKFDIKAAIAALK